MRWTAKGTLHPTCFLDAATLHLTIKVTCKCGHYGRFEPHGLWWHFKRRGWDDHFIPAKARFWCRMCHSNYRRKVRPQLLEPVAWEKGDIELPWPDEREWKRAMARVR